MRVLLISLALLISISRVAAAADAVAEIKIARPVPYEVVQREGFVPARGGANEPGGPALGFADVNIGFSAATSAKADCEARAVALEGVTGEAWKKVDVVSADNVPSTATLCVPAGGWYRLELRLRREDKVIAQGAVEPFGVGEVFLVAGQSYATNCNDEQFKVADKAGRVAAYDGKKGAWRVAHDPQPVEDGSGGGSIWPVVGDLLLPSARVPIGFANVAVGGTSSSEWLPEGKLHPKMVEVGRKLGRFRAVLWQQGESDVIGKVPSDQYVKNVSSIRAAAVKAWQFEPPWLLAKSTLHPTVYSDPDGEARIRRGIDVLCKQPGFVLGPDTDTLAGDNRGGPTTRRHFSGLGQRNAAALWFATLVNELNRPQPEKE